jgi:hypothetical protein
MTTWDESIICSAEGESGGYRGGDIAERFALETVDRLYCRRLAHR